MRYLILITLILLIPSSGYSERIVINDMWKYKNGSIYPNNAKLKVSETSSPWRLFYSDGDGNMSELPLGTTGQYLKSLGLNAVPAWDTPSGGGGNPSDGDVGQVQISDGAGAFLGYSGFTYNSSTKQVYVEEGFTTKAKPDPTAFYNSSTINDTDWWTGVSTNEDGADNDCYEIRVNSFPGNSVKFEVCPSSTTSYSNLFGLVPSVFSSSASLVLGAASCTGEVYYLTSGTAQDITLPNVVNGKNCCFSATQAAVITIDTYDTGDRIVLDGVPLTLGNAIDSSGSVGDFICLHGATNGAATDWRTLGRSGTWVDGGVD